MTYFTANIDIHEIQNSIYVYFRGYLCQQQRQVPESCPKVGRCLQASAPKRGVNFFVKNCQKFNFWRS